MKKTRNHLRATGLALAVLGATLLVPSARAATAAQQGWWNRLPVVVGAPVDEGQLLVEGAPDDAVATAAVRFVLADGEAAETLVLPVADQQLQPDAVVVACTTSSDWAPAEGGDWQDRPTPACENAVEGVLADDGESWSFAVASLQADDVLDVVLLPAPNATMRVVFDRATADALRVSVTDPDPVPIGQGEGGGGGGSEPGTGPGTSTTPDPQGFSPPTDSGSTSSGLPAPSFGLPAPDPAEPTDETDAPARSDGARAATPRAAEASGDLAAAATEQPRSSQLGLFALLAAGVLAFVALRRGRPAALAVPEGVASTDGARAVPLGSTVPGPADAPPAPADLGDPLVAESVSVHFGGVRALQDVSIRIGPGEIVGLIGGNGAGKTTFMDCVSGYVVPDEGSITTFGQQLVGTSPEMRPYLDVARGYQSARLYPGLTVEETLLVALERTRPTGVLAAVLRTRRGREAEAAKRDRADEVIETLGLAAYRDKRVGELSTGTRRVLDVACMLAQEPKLLLLDEPTAGLAQRETEAFGPLLKRLQRQLGCAILIIEHDIVLISSVCDRVYALETGRVLAEGDPDTVRQDPRVVASYLGTDDAAIFRSGNEGPERAAVAEPGASELASVGAGPVPGVRARASNGSPAGPRRRSRRREPLRAGSGVDLDARRA